MTHLAPRDLPARLRRALGPLVLALTVPPAAAQGLFGPSGPEIRVNDNPNYSQYWVRVASNDAATRIGFSFNSGQDMFARFFSQNGPITPDRPCNITYKTGIQDEGEIGWSVDGHFLVAWSERSGADGEQMGIFGRIYTADGNATTPAEFQINEEWQASQWRPLIATHPAGGWVVAFTGDWDADALYRIVNSDGTFATGDINVDTFGNGAQADTAPAVAPDGTTFMAFVDYSGASNWGLGTDIWFRLFDASGNPLMAKEQVVTPFGAAAGDQREPRVAADGLGRFVVVWEDDTNDGAGWGIFGRRFGPTGKALGPVFQVNTTVNNSQRQPRVAADAVGNFTVTWTDHSGGDADIVAQRYDTNGVPIGAEFTVNEKTSGLQELPSLVIVGEKTIFCYEGPFIQRDVFARVYSSGLAPVNYCTAGFSASGCQATLSAAGLPSATSSSGFDLMASAVEGSKDGLYFFSTNGRQANSWGSGTSYQCVVPPVFRAGLLLGSGTPAACDGSFAQDLNALWCPTCPRPLKNPGAGATVQAQLWYRDPLNTSNQTTSLSDALEFVVQP